MGRRLHDPRIVHIPSAIPRLQRDWPAFQNLRFARNTHWGNDWCWPSFIVERPGLLLLLFSIWYKCYITRDPRRASGPMATNWRPRCTSNSRSSTTRLSPSWWCTQVRRPSNSSTCFCSGIRPEDLQPSRLSSKKQAAMKGKQACILILFCCWFILATLSSRGVTILRRWWHCRPVTTKRGSAVLDESCRLTRRRRSSSWGRPVPCSLCSRILPSIWNWHRMRGNGKLSSRNPPVLSLSGRTTRTARRKKSTRKTTTTDSKIFFSKKPAWIVGSDD